MNIALDCVSFPCCGRMLPDGLLDRFMSGASLHCKKCGRRWGWNNGFKETCVHFQGVDDDFMASYLNRVYGSGLMQSDPFTNAYHRAIRLLDSRSGVIKPAQIQPPEPIVVFLTGSSMDKCRSLKRSRQRIKDEMNIPNNKKANNLTDEAAHDLGVRCEVAVAQQSGSDVDATTYARGDGGVIDLTTPVWRRSMQVKGRMCHQRELDDGVVWAYTNHQLMDEERGYCYCCGKDAIKKSDVLLADYIVAAMGDSYDETKITVLGYLARPEFLARSHWHEGLYSGQPRFVVSHRFLRPASELVTL